MAIGELNGADEPQGPLGTTAPLAWSRHENGRRLAMGQGGLIMPSDIRNKFEQAIRDEDEKSLGRLRASHESTRLAEERFVPVRQAAEELREQIRPVPDIELTVNPDSVWIVLADRNLRFTYDAESLKFTCEEGAHSWYDGEEYSDRYEWDDADACIDAMIRLCAKYVRMARAISAAST